MGESFGAAQKLYPYIALTWHAYRNNRCINISSFLGKLTMGALLLLKMSMHTCRLYISVYTVYIRYAQVGFA